MSLTSTRTPTSSAPYQDLGRCRVPELFTTLAGAEATRTTALCEPYLTGSSASSTAALAMALFTTCD